MIKKKKKRKQRHQKMTEMLRHLRGAYKCKKKHCWRWKWDFTSLISFWIEFLAKHHHSSLVQTDKNDGLCTRYCYHAYIHFYFHSTASFSHHHSLWLCRKPKPCSEYIFQRWNTALTSKCFRTQSTYESNHVLLRERKKTHIFYNKSRIVESFTK